MVTKNEIGALLVRITVGLLFFMHGFVKFQNGIDTIASWFSTIGLPSFLAYFVAYFEIIGGFLLLVGLCQFYLQF